MKRIFTSLPAILILFFVNAQSIGIGTNAPNNSAALDITTTSKGLLIPRMTMANIASISNPAKGLMVYDSLKNQLMVNMGTATTPSWQSIVASSGWDLNGNGGTDPSNQFIGSTDNQPINFRINNTAVGQLNTSGNIFWGLRAAQNNTTGYSNVVIGTDALKLATGSHNQVAIGDSALLNSNSSGILNIAIGSKSLYSNTGGYFNVAIGDKSLYSNIGGGSNTAVGSASLYKNTTGNDNTAIGEGTMSSNVSGKNNTAVGSGAFELNLTGDDNTGIGYEVLFENVSGTGNTATGKYSLWSNTSGSGNTGNGLDGLFSNLTGDYNTATGSEALYSNTTGNFNTAEGNQALYWNIAGSYNTATGLNALYNNRGDLASFNTGVGFQALFNTTNSQYNVAVGYNAGSGQDNGYNNVFLGANTNVDGAGYYNVIAIGQGTVCNGSSQVTIGNGATGSYRAYANWSNISDGRFKKNIQENVPGLAFITQLRPVTYNLNATGLDEFLHANTSSSTVTNAGKAGKPDEKITTQPYTNAAKSIYNKALKEKETSVYTGFVAQEVETTAKKLGFNFSGIDAPKNGNDVYGLRYAEFVVPLVKAVQEQQQQIMDLKQQNDTLLKRLEKLETLLHIKN